MEFETDKKNYIVNKIIMVIIAVIHMLRLLPEKFLILSIIMIICFPNKKIPLLFIWRWNSYLIFSIIMTKRFLNQKSYGASVQTSFGRSQWSDRLFCLG